VVEQVLLGLQRRPECSLELCALLSYPTLDHAIRYVRENGETIKAPVVAPAVNSGWIARQEAFGRECYDSIQRINEGIDTRPARLNLLPRSRRKLLLGLARMADAGIRRAGRRNHEAVRKRPADLFHSPFLQPLPALAIPRFLTVHDLLPVRFPEYFSGFTATEPGLTKAVLGSLTPADWMFAISQATKDDLCSYRPDLDPKRIFITPLAADSRFRPCVDPGAIESARKRYGLPAGPYILSVATLEPRKNLKRVIRCFARLVREGAVGDLSLVLVGAKGWGYESMFDELSNSGPVKDRIFVTGYVADEDLAPIYSAALAFIYCSLCEGFGMPPLEAMQCGTPVICSDNTSLPEVVGDAAMLVGATDEDALCHGMWEMVKNSGLRRTLAAKGLERAKQFSWERCVDKVLEGYRTALSAR